MPGLNKLIVKKPVHGKPTTMFKIVNNNGDLHKGLIVKK